MTDGPAAEVDITPDLCRRLVAAQLPELADQPLAPAGEGWDNVMMRIGEAGVMRLPRRASAARQMERESALLPRIAPHLPLPVPAPHHLGRPGEGYPFPWSVLPWFPGETAMSAEVTIADARVLARFLRSLHRPAPSDVPLHPQRGVPLAAIAADAALLVARAPTPAHRAWEAGLAAAPSSERVWIHGDLHPGNLILEGGRLSAVIDWGNIGSGDPATDLAVFWLGPGPEVRRAALAVYGAGPDLTARAAARAVAFLARFLVAGAAPHLRTLALAAMRAAFPD